MKRAMQNTDAMIAVVRVLDAAEGYENGYFEQLAVGYNTKDDGLELVILSRGQGAGDDRVLADMDSDEILSPGTLIEAYWQLRHIAEEEGLDEYYELADFVKDQAEFLSRKKSE